MGIGSVLVGVAMAIGVGAYLARPFRARTADLDRAIELWVGQAHAGDRAEPDRGDDVSFCSNCGRPVDADDRFCSGCGTRMRGGA